MNEDINHLLRQEPFQPFRIVLTSGDRYDVSFPNLVAVGKSQLTLYYPRSDRHVALRLNQIAAIEVNQEAA